MENFNYEWNQTDNDEAHTNFEINVEDGLKTRNDLQLARRAFHMANGTVVATLYFLTFTHEQMIRSIGTIACLIYIVEQVRINYPEMAKRLLPISKFIIRAEEQLKESAMIPYALAVLLTIITFPKPIALISIYILAISDPLSAIVGIRFGKNRIVPHKTLEGSAAFLISSLIISVSILMIYNPEELLKNIIVSSLLSLLISTFEMLPIKIDDNLTIPLVGSFILWTLCSLFSVSF